MAYKKNTPAPSSRSSTAPSCGGIISNGYGNYPYNDVKYYPDINSLSTGTGTSISTGNSPAYATP